MSQLQVTGEAKIRDIQGPVVANSGVITALDGAASQYVRGDGTLADFPTSTGGGSSVSYYLNSSVSQGTIGGVAYRELSKDPIIGAGTDITISANGYVANYITDANDPDVTIVPGGNFNCEFYFSVNNNTGSPTTYAELYKYDGTTFTLLGTSAGVPESINQGTTIAPYYFAIPVATAALSVTDRLAIRIYVSVDGRTVTLHTENGHLCQVVTTLSKGMVSLNNLTDQSQYLTTGTSGTNFNIVSSGDTHTFNLPVASATNTGKLSSTDWSTFNNKVPYTGATGSVDLGLFGLTSNAVKAIGDNSTYGGVISIKQNNVIGGLIGTGYTELFGKTNRLGISFGAGSIAYLSNSVLTAERTYTLPDATGTIALTSNLSSYVPYTGATNNVDLGIYNIFSSFVYAEGAGGSTNGGILIKQYSGALAANSGYTSLFATPNQLGINFSGAYNTFLQSGTLTASRTYTLPDLSGTLALLEGTQTFSGSKTFTQSPISEGGYSFKILASGTLFGNGYSVISSLAGNVSISQAISAGNLKSFTFDFSSWATNTFYTYALPASDGTIALTSDLTTYVPYTGATANVDLGGFSLYLNNGQAVFGRNFTGTTSYALIGVNPSNKVSIDNSALGTVFGGSLTGQTYIANGIGTQGGTIALKQNGLLSASTGYTTLGALSAGQLVIYFGDTNAYAATFLNTSLTDSRSYTLPNANGTIALTSNLSSYVPYTGATASLEMGNGTFGIQAGQFILFNRAGSSTLGSSAYQAFLDATQSNGVYLQLNASNDLSLFGRTSGVTTGALTTFGKNGNVTIGGTSLLNKLSVQSDATFVLGTSNSYAVGIANGGGNNLTLGTAATYAAIQTWSSIPLVLQGAGNNVLIGTTTDSTFKLDVSGTGRFSGQLTANSFVPTSSTIPTNGMYLSAANTLNFATNSANRFTIASDGVATFGTDLYVNRNIYVNEAESGIYADFHGRNSTSTSTPLAFLYGSAGTVTWNNGGTKMTLTSAGALELVSSISATSATLNGNVIINSTATALSPLQVVATGTIVRLGEQSGTTGKQFLIGIDATSGRTELQSVWQGTAFTSLSLQPSGGNVSIGSTVDSGFKTYIKAGASGILLSAGTTSSDNTLLIQNAAETTTLFNIKGNGAATFSSSVTIGSNLTLNSSSLLRLGNSDNASTMQIWNSQSGGINNLLIYDNAANAYRFVIGNTGNVGIGTSSPRARLDVSDGTDNTSGEAIYQGLFTGPTRPSTSDLTAILTVQSNSAMGANNGGSIAFGGRALSSNSSGANWAGIGGLKENGTSGDYNGYLQFWTRGGAQSEKMRITSAGQLYFSRNSGGTDVINIESFTGFTGRGILLNMDAGSDAITIGGAGSQNAINVTSSSKKVIISNLGGSGTVTVQADNSGTLIKSSDSSLKQEDKEYKIQGLAEILQLQPRAYKWLKDIEIRKEEAVTEIGFFADEVNPIIPSAAPKGFDGLYGFNDRAVTAALVKAIQEQQEQIEELKQLIKNK